MAPDVRPLRAFIARTWNRDSDMRTLWRLGAWGTFAAVALAAVVFTSQTERGSERLRLAFSGSAPVQAAAIADAQKRATEAQAETQRLAAQVRALTADRDRLAARIAGLEHNIGDLTGSIKTQAEAAAARAVAALPDTLPKIASVAPAPAVAAPPAPPAPPGEPAKAVAQDGAVQGAEPPPPVAPALPAAVPVPAPPAIAAAPPPQPVPMPPVRVAAAPTAEPAPPQPGKPEIGIDIGGSSTLVLLSARWKAVKANHGPLLIGLHAVSAHEHRPGRLPYRLVLGPLPDAAAAARLCAQFAAARTACHPTQFAGEALPQQ